LLQLARCSAVAAAFALTTSVALAQTTAPAAAPAADAPAMSATMPPRAPTYPTPPKPDFSSMRFLLGTWKCVSHSERRGNVTSSSTVTYTMAPDGYFIVGKTVSPKVAYAAVGFKSTDWITYDGLAKRWIDVTIGTYGAYGYSTSVGWQFGHLVWNADSFLPDGDITSTTGTMLTKVSDTKFTTASAFTSSAGLLNRVTGSCTKQ